MLVIQPTAAHVAQANTDATDSQTYVWHEVFGRSIYDGSRYFLKLMASDPMDAISRSIQIQPELWMKQS